MMMIIIIVIIIIIIIIIKFGFYYLLSQPNNFTFPVLGKSGKTPSYLHCFRR
jgi:hypothetical protein